jgi:hypothetical protein
VIAPRNLNPARKHQHDDNQENDSEAAARKVAPTAAVTPRRQGADEKEDQKDNQNGSEAHRCTYVQLLLRSRMLFGWPLHLLDADR